MRPERYIVRLRRPWQRALPSGARRRPQPPAPVRSCRCGTRARSSPSISINCCPRRFGVGRQHARRPRRAHRRRLARDRPRAQEWTSGSAICLSGAGAQASPAAISSATLPPFSVSLSRPEAILGRRSLSRQQPKPPRMGAAHAAPGGLGDAGPTPVSPFSGSPTGKHQLDEELAGVGPHRGAACVVRSPSTIRSFPAAPSTIRLSRVSNSALAAVEGADAVVVMTPWPEFGGIDVGGIAERMAGTVLIDPYGLLDRRAAEACGLDYFTLGAPPLRREADEGDA